MVKPSQRFFCKIDPIMKMQRKNLSKNYIQEGFLMRKIGALVIIPPVRNSRLDFLLKLIRSLLQTEGWHLILPVIRLPVL